MQHGWKKVYIFVSSTFNDMHAERDYLVKRVYPELQDWCEQRKLRLIDVDLRWGVTEREAVENKEAVNICLERIDLCRPFFVCFVGQRYGWVPEVDEISGDTFGRDRYPLLKPVVEQRKYSITELEIRHAVITPFHSPDNRPDNLPKALRTSEKAFFYVRHPGYLRDLPNKPRQLREIYTDSNEVGAEARRAALCELTEVTIPGAGRTARQYVATWRGDPGHSTPELAVPYSCPSRRKATVARWRADWKEYAGINIQSATIPAGSPEEKRAKRYNLRLTKGRLTDFQCLRPGGKAALGRVILNDLREAIKSVYPRRRRASSRKGLEADLDRHEEFRLNHSEDFIERPGVFAKLDEYVRDATDRRLFTLTGDSGIGKSALLAKWVDRYISGGRRLARATFHARFIGVSDQSASVDGLLGSLLRELKERHHKVSGEIPLDSRQLREKWSEALEQVRRRGKTVIVLDALDQLDTGLRDLAWLPFRLPSGVKIVVSFRRGAAKAEELSQRLSASDCILSEVLPFKSKADRRRLVETYLWQYLKRLDDESLDNLVSFPGATNPLFLKVVLSELRVFGAYAGLQERVRQFYGDSPLAAFEGLLKRLETDMLPVGLNGSIAVPLIFGSLAHARRGLSDAEMVELLLKHYPWASGADRQDSAGGSPAGRRQVALDAIHVYLRQVRSFMARYEGRNDFFYESFKQAAASRYTGGRARALQTRTLERWHEILADLFRAQANPNPGKAWGDASGRSLNELAYHLSRTRDVEATERLYTDLSYLEAMCLSATGVKKPRAEVAHTGTYDLIANIQDAIRFLRAAPSPPRARQSDLRTQEARMAALDRLTRIERTLALESHTLSRWRRRENPAYFAQQIHKRALDLKATPLAQSAEARLCQLACPYIMLWSRAGQQTDGLERILVGHERDITAVHVSADALSSVSASQDGTLRLWDLESGREMLTFEGHDGRVNALAIDKDWRRMISGSNDRTLRLWSLDSGLTTRVFVGHKDKVSVVSLTRDGKRAVSGGDKGEVRIWNLETGTELKVRASHKEAVSAIAVDEDGRRAISASYDRTLKVWDIATGRLLRTLRGHKGAVVAVDLTEDGRYAISGGYNEEQNLRAWDLDSGEQLHSAADHWARVDAVLFTHRGEALLTTSLFSPYINLWDFSDFYEYKTLAAAGNVNSITVTPDGERAVAVAGGHLQSWNLRGCTESCDIAGYEINARTLGVDSAARRAVTGEENGFLRVWDLNVRGRYWGRKQDTGHRDKINDIVIFPDGNHAATASDDTTVRIWDVSTGEQVRVLEGHTHYVTALAVSADSRHVVSASADRTLRVWDVKTGQSLHTLAGHSRPSQEFARSGRRVGPPDSELENDPSLLAMLGAVNAVALTHDGRRAVSASADYTLKVWDVETGKELNTLRGHSAPVRVVAITPDGLRAVSGSWDYTLKTWDLKDYRELRAFRGHEAEVKLLLLTPDGRRVISGSNDKTLRVWDIESGRQLCVMSDDARDWSVGSAVVTRDGRRVVACGGRIRVWDIETGKKLCTGSDHEYAVARPLAVTPDGRHAIVSWIDAPTVEVWNIEQPARVAVIEVEQPISCLRILQDGASVITGGYYGDVSLLRTIGL